MEDVEGRVKEARGGDPQAWRMLVDGHTGLVWSVIRGFRFDDDTSKDVFQTVWLRTAEHLDRIREPSKLASWLGQTTRNECIGVVRQRTRIVVTDEVIDLTEPTGELLSNEPAPGDGLLRDESRMAVAAGFERLSERCQQLLRMLIVDPPVSYDQISELLDLPIGSIGPTRARCLETLRSTPEIFRISGEFRSS